MKLKSNNPFRSLPRLWNLLDRKWKYRTVLLMIFMFVSGFAEMITLGSIVPFLAVLIDFSVVLTYPYVGELLNYLEINEERDLLVFFSFSFCIAIAFAALLRMLIARLYYRWCYA